MNIISESIVKFTWSLSKLMAFLLFTVSVIFDTGLMISKINTSPDTLFYLLPYIVGLIGFKQGVDGINSGISKFIDTTKKT